MTFRLVPGCSITPWRNLRTYLKRNTHPMSVNNSWELRLLNRRAPTFTLKAGLNLHTWRQVLKCCQHPGLLYWNLLCQRDQITWTAPVSLYSSPKVRQLSCSHITVILYCLEAKLLRHAGNWRLQKIWSLNFWILCVKSIWGCSVTCHDINLKIVETIHT